MAKRPGRNERCPCGSGLKYKHCHLDWDAQGITGGEQPTSLRNDGDFGGYGVVLGGERPHPDRWQKWDIPGGSIGTKDPAEVFKARLGPFSLDSVVTLVADLT